MSFNLLLALLFKYKPYPQLRLSCSCPRLETKTEPAKGKINSESMGLQVINLPLSI